MNAFIQSNVPNLLLTNRLNPGHIARQSAQRYGEPLIGARRRSFVIRSTLSETKTDEAEVQIRDPSTDFSALTKSETTEKSVDINSSESKVDKGTAIADAILQDMSKRPEYYVNISGLFFGTLLALVVASAVLGTLNHIPFVPDMLKIIGLGYTFWFLRKYLTIPETREELQKEMDDLVSTIRGDAEIEHNKTTEGETNNDADGLQPTEMSNLQQQS